MSVRPAVAGWIIHEASMPDSIETLIRAKKVVLGVRFDTVTIELVCGGDYEAQVLFDDLAERMQAGQEISIDPTGEAA